MSKKSLKGFRVKVLFGLFMETLPKTLELWRNGEYSKMPFDEYLLESSKDGSSIHGKVQQAIFKSYRPMILQVIERWKKSVYAEFPFETYLEEVARKHNNVPHKEVK